MSPESFESPPHATDIALFTWLVEELHRLREVACQHQHETDREVRDRVGIASRRRQHQDSVGRARVDVDVNRIAAATSHHPQVRRFAQHFGVHCVYLGDKHLHPGERLDEILAGEQPQVLAEALIAHFAELAQRSQSFFVERRRHQDVRTRRLVSRCAARRVFGRIGKDRLYRA